MRVNVAVCGIFHYRKYIGELSRRGVLRRFYFSHRWSTDNDSLGMVSGEAINLYLKEHILRGGIWAMTGLGSADWLAPLVHRLWEHQLLRRWKNCEVFHLMLHGTARRALAHARRRGAVTIGEPVMSHPKMLQRLVEEEHELLGLPKPPPMEKTMSRLIEETRECDYLLAGSEFIRRTFAAEGFPPERIHVLQYAVDPVNFYPLNDSERGKLCDGKFRVICVAQIVPRKGQHYLLEAWKRLGLSRDQGELVLVGKMSPEMEKVLQKYDGLFTYKRHVPHAALRLEYGRSSVFVLPSVEDGFGYVTTEAMGCGLPVITTHNAGSADVVEEGRNGYVVPVRSADAIAERLERLYRDAALRRSMSDRSIEMSRTGRGWPGYVDALVEFYAKTVRSGVQLK